MKPKFNPDKPFCLREDLHKKPEERKKVRIICRDAKGYYPLIALTKEDGQEVDSSHTIDGLFEREIEGRLDLVNISEKIERWVNIYSREYGHATKEEADACAGNAKDRIACIPIEFTEGEGL